MRKKKLFFLIFIISVAVVGTIFSFQKGEKAEAVEIRAIHGTVYIDGQLATGGSVMMKFSDVELIGSIDEHGDYIVSFSGHQEKTAIFYIEILYPDNDHKKIFVPVGSERTLLIGAASDYLMDFHVYPSNTLGWAWSENVGWLSFNYSNCANTSSPGCVCDVWDTIPGCPESAAGKINCGAYCAKPEVYGLDVATDGRMAGRIWSNNIGWITFNNNEVQGCPAGDCQPRLNMISGTTSGWARSCAVFENKNACSGALDPERGSWDGWLSLSCYNSGCSLFYYGVQIQTVESHVFAPENKSLVSLGIPEVIAEAASPDVVPEHLPVGTYWNYLWGGDVLGWVSFNCGNCVGEPSEKYCNQIGPCGTKSHPDYYVWMNPYDTIPIPNQPPTAIIGCDISSCYPYPSEDHGCLGFTSRPFNTSGGCPTVLLNGSTDPDGELDIIKSVWFYREYGEVAWREIEACNFEGKENCTPQHLCIDSNCTGKREIMLEVMDSEYQRSSTTLDDFYVYQDAIAGFKCSLDPEALPENWRECNEINIPRKTKVYFRDDINMGPAPPPFVHDYSQEAGPTVIANEIVYRKWEVVGREVMSEGNSTSSSALMVSPSDIVRLTIRDMIVDGNVGRVDTQDHAILITYPSPVWRERSPAEVE